MKKIIYLQAIGEINPSVLIRLQKDLKFFYKDFVETVKILPDSISLEKKEYIRFKRQYEADPILYKLKKLARKNQFFRILGIMEEDIFSGYLNFVFGIAEKPKLPYSKSTCASLISTARLEEKFYNRLCNKALSELRTLKEAIHELGHTFNLSHCKNLCIMRFSNSLADTDEKPPGFCSSCMEKLNRFF